MTIEDLPRKIPKSEAESILKEMALAGCHVVYRVEEDTLSVGVGRRVVAYELQGDEWIQSAIKTIGAIMASFFAEKLTAESFARQVFRVTEDKK